MENKPDHIDDLIASYLMGEATPGQQHLVDEWRMKNDSNRQYFQHLKIIFEKAATVTNSETFETDKAWERLRAKIQAQGHAKVVPMRNQQSSYTSLFKIAAGLALLIMAGLFTWQYFNADKPSSIRVLADKKMESDTLPDGSGVFLNKQTKIEYEFNRNKKVHTAKLTGEAYFNINHDDQKTFIVEADGVFIKDIGTSFNVKAYPDSSTVEVVVEEGEVMFYSEGNPGVYLKANGKGIYNKKTKTFTVSDPEPNVTAYKTKFFSFSDNNLAAVVKTLNAVYTGKIEINEKVAGCRLTVSFNNESLDEIAVIISETLGLKLKKNGDVIRLEGSGCDDE